jgi:hypothetical protein
MAILAASGFSPGKSRVVLALPEGMCLKCLDNDKTNTDLSNWELIPRALLPRLDGRFGRGYKDAPPELRPTIMVISKLEHKAREAKS